MKNHLVCLYLWKGVPLWSVVGLYLDLPSSELLAKVPFYGTLGCVNTSAKKQPNLGCGFYHSGDESSSMLGNSFLGHWKGIHWTRTTFRQEMVAFESKN